MKAEKVVDECRMSLAIDFIRFRVISRRLATKIFCRFMIDLEDLDRDSSSIFIARIKLSLRDSIDRLNLYFALLISPLPDSIYHSNL